MSEKCAHARRVRANAPLTFAFDWKEANLRFILVRNSFNLKSSCSLPLPVGLPSHIRGEGIEPSLKRTDYQIDFQFEITHTALCYPLGRQQVIKNGLSCLLFNRRCFVGRFPRKLHGGL